MPNWTTNGIACHKDALKLFVNEEGQVDFNMLRPMPESLNIVSGSITREAIDAANGENVEVHPRKADDGFGTPLPFDIETLDDLKRLGEIYLDNKKKYGATTWYDWCCDNWGTKWNACQTQIETYGDLAIVTFDTAWAQPRRDMFEIAFEKAGFGYVAEAYDEDFYGIYEWGADGYFDDGIGDIFRTVHETDDYDGEEYGWDTGEYEPNVESLMFVLGIE